VSSAVSLLVAHGYVVLFAYVLASQLGAPLPSSPLILAAGALAAKGRIEIGTTIAVVVFACACADTIWYQLGRTQGGKVVRALCRISLEPEACVRQTQKAFGRLGSRFLLVTKFLPGVGLMAAPIAGQTKMPYRLFVAFDTTGAAIWASTYALLGLLLGKGIERNAELLQVAARFGAVAVLGAAIIALGVRLFRRRRFRRLLPTDRIRPAELKSRLDRGDPVYVVDLRNPLLLDAQPESLPGAIHLNTDDVIAGESMIPRDREIVLFCDCPGEASAALVAGVLQKRGFKRARALEGGIDGWRRAGYPVAPLRGLDVPRRLAGAGDPREGLAEVVDVVK
jgi:membrane protein DedA with SNARE-associated domain/rhodanese-related sulfurtransferase